MEITVTGRKMSISDPLRSYVEEKIGSSTKVFNITPMRAEVVLHVERNPANPHPAVAEVTLFTKGHIIRSEEAEEDMYAAIDVAAAKVERQLRKYKTRVLDKRLHGGKLQDVLVGVDDEQSDVSVLEVPTPDDDSRIVRIKEVALEVLTEEEALIKIDLIGHDFFVFTSSTDGLTNVLYRRKDGSYGILKPRVESIDG